MNKITIIIIWTLLLSIFTPSFHAIANDRFTRADTLRLFLPNKATIEIASVNAGKLPLNYNLFTQSLNQFIEYSKAINIEDIMLKSPHIFNMKISRGFILSLTDTTINKHELSITERSPGHTINFSSDPDDTMYLTGKHIFQFESWDQSFKVYFDTMPQLIEISKMDMPTIMSDISESLTKWKGRGLKKMAFTYNYIVNEDNSFNTKNADFHSPSDKILLTFGTGLEHLKDAFVGSFQVGLGVAIKKKLVHKNIYSVTYDWLYDFSSPDEHNINHFLSAGYKHNFSNNPGSDKWYGLSLGYLIKKEGDLFEDNTLRLGIHRQIHNHLRVEPQIYFNDFFKDVYPGLKVSWSF